MPSTPPATHAEYVRAAPPMGQAHLRRVLAIFRAAAPDADEVIMWRTPFSVEPRFLFAVSAFKAHLSLAFAPATLVAFRDELADYSTTQQYLQVPYDLPLPEALIRRLAEYRARVLAARDDDAFWDPPPPD